ncbi:MAG: rhodanese-like domain-containing protein [Actinobacteria bacterium]|nr:rhodanese-like domain-containing protein [Actinomycetota bacterium]
MIRFWKILAIVSFVFVIALFSVGCLEQKVASETEKVDKPPYQDVTVDEAKRLIDTGNNIFIVDVRTQQEYDDGHIPGANLIPVDKFEKAVSEGKIPPGKTVLIYCRSGNRSKRAADILGKTGYNYVESQSVNNMLGGFSEWQSKGYPVE